ncbi:MAG: YdaU family protein [Planctomycetes bacterium]|nr:YdaU family protein [Planctomycetota bacterium]
MTKPPAFQFYPKDWLSSPRVQLMTPEQEGAYIRLLCYCWDSGDCSLPDDDDELAVLSRLGEGWLNGGSTVVRKCFIPHPAKPGFLSNARLLEESEKQGAWKRKSSEGGKKSAAKRAENKAILKGASTVAQPNTNRSLQPNANSASSSASSPAVKSEDDDQRAHDATPFQRVYDLGCELFPQLATQNTSSIHQWITSGADVDLDILPEIKRIHGKGVKPRGWGLFTQDIADAKARREAPLPQGDPKPERLTRKHSNFEKQDYFAGTEGFEVIGGPNVAS